MSNLILQANNLVKTFSETKQTVKVLQSVNLEVMVGQTISIMGASGSGKSTLLHLLGGLDRPTSGKVILKGKDLALMSENQIGAWRNNYLGFVYQFHHLLPELTALENVALPLRIRRQKPEQANFQAAKYLSQVGLDNRIDHRPAQLSGGERQRVAIARALVTQPACVLADEPTGNLDRQAADKVFELILKLSLAQKTAFIVVTHDLQLATKCQLQLQLKAGRLVAI